MVNLGFSILQEKNNRHRTVKVLMLVKKMFGSISKNYFSSGNALRCIFSQSKGLDWKDVLLASLTGGLILQVCPWAS